MDRFVDMPTKEELVRRTTTTWNHIHAQTREVVAKVPQFTWLDVRTVKMACMFVCAWFSASILFLAVLVHVFPQKKMRPGAKEKVEMAKAVENPSDKGGVMKGRVLPSTSKPRSTPDSPPDEASSALSSPTPSPILHSPATPGSSGTGSLRLAESSRRLSGAPGITRRTVYGRPASPFGPVKSSLPRSGTESSLVASTGSTPAAGAASGMAPSPSLSAFQASPLVKNTFSTTEELSPGTEVSQNIKLVAPSETPSFIPIEHDSSRSTTPTRRSSNVTSIVVSRNSPRANLLKKAGLAGR